VAGARGRGRVVPALRGTVTDSALPYLRVDAAQDECFVVHGVRRGHAVELELVRCRRQRRMLRQETLERISAAWLARFDATDGAAWDRYASCLETLARYAARGELGFYVETTREADRIHVKLVHRDFDGVEITTEVVEKQDFPSDALVDANERAEALRGKAEDLNGEAAARRHAAYRQQRAEFDEADARAREAAELAEIVRSEGTGMQSLDL
jgi:hypothetical protein